MNILQATFNQANKKTAPSQSRFGRGKRWLLAGGALLFCFVAAGCDRQGNPMPVSMWNGTRLKPYQQNTFLPGDSSSLTPPVGTVWRGQVEQDRLYPPGTFAPVRDMYAAGITPVYNEGTGNEGPTGDYRVRGAGATMDKFPFPITEKVLLRGQERYDIYCAPCHGRTGYGDGMIVRRGFSQPPSYHQERLREAPVGHFFDVITNGFGAMYPYGDRITPEDRWAIIAYIRALQLSQNANIEDVPAAERSQLKDAPVKKLPQNMVTEKGLVPTER